MLKWRGMRIIAEGLKLLLSIPITCGYTNVHDLIGRRIYVHDHPVSGVFGDRNRLVAEGYLKSELVPSVMPYVAEFHGELVDFIDEGVHVPNYPGVAIHRHNSRSSVGAHEIE